uniref:CS domain-containing protein n=1 Tax=Steinernema glaseri TaxID=37863 RepID=A0A1I7YCL2_9BILA
MSLHPQILWAQREKELLLTVAVEDMKVEDLYFKNKTFHIKGTNSNGSQQYEASLELFEELDPDSLRKFPTTRQLEMVIDKKNPDWWPRLTSAKGKCAWVKCSWVKVDTNKWKDEDDEDISDVSSMDTGNFDMSSLLGGGMEGMGGLGDLSMGGLGDTSGAGGDLSDLGGDEVDYASNKSQDEDDEDVNDVSSVIEDGEDDFSNLEGDELDYGTDEGDHVPVEEDDQGRGKPGIVWEDYAPVDYGTDEGDDMPPLEAAEETSEAKP